jgi:hypothetical protein
MIFLHRLKIMFTGSAEQEELEQLDSLTVYSQVRIWALLLS